MSLTLRHASDFFRVEIDEDRRRVIVARLAASFASRVQAETACISVLESLAELDRGSHTLVLDAREATGVNDPEYESWYAPFRRQIVSGFRGVAVVLKTASGRLQARRLAQDDRQRGLAFVGTIEEADEDLDRR